MIRRKNFQYLKPHILPLSAASDCNNAKREWELHCIFINYGHQNLKSIV